MWAEGSSAGTLDRRSPLGNSSACRATIEERILSAMPDHNDREAIRMYAERLPSFGGIYEESGTLVVLMTEVPHDLLASLRTLISSQTRVSIMRSLRTWSDVLKEHDRLVELIFSSQTLRSSVNGVGLGISEGQFVSHVGVHPFNEQTVSLATSVLDSQYVQLIPQRPALARGARKGPEKQLAPQTCRSAS